MDIKLIYLLRIKEQQLYRYQHFKWKRVPLFSQISTCQNGSHYFHRCQPVKTAPTIFTDVNMSKRLPLFSQMSTCQNGSHYFHRCQHVKTAPTITQMSTCQNGSHYFTDVNIQGGHKPRGSKPMAPTIFTSVVHSTRV